MKDQPSTTDDDDDDDEPVRFSMPKLSMDEYLEYDPKTDSYRAPGIPSTYDAEAELRKVQELIENLKKQGVRKGLIPVDDLRAAGVLDAPDRRKSLGGGRPNVKRNDPRQRDLFSGLEDDEPAPPEEAQAEEDADEEAEADEDS